jgi:haloacid dehalogenase superfamily, subfamily IA, variant 1 with third motif having Dx(3-4)D or Dx(3-4)E
MNAFPFDIVGFDLDGTLLDTHRDLAHALNHTLVRDGRQMIPIEEVRPMIGGGARKMLARALEVSGRTVDDARFEELHDALLEYYEANIAVESCLFPGGEEMLQDLEQSGVRLTVVTNKLERFAKKILMQLGLADRFVTIIGGDTLGPGCAKPKPDLLLEMLRRAGEGRAAYVGDTTYDTRAALAANIPCVAVRFGFNDIPVEDMGAAAVISHFDELVPALRRL